MTASLPGGTSIEATIMSPADGAQFVVDAGGTATVSLEGTASVGAVDQPQATLVYVVDLSGSTQSASGGDCGGDVAVGFGANTILDCEAAAILALNDAAITAGTIGRVGFVGYASGAQAAIVVPGPGSVTLTEPDADQNDNGIPDIEEVVRSLRPGAIQTFQFRSVGTATNFEAGLAATQNLIEATGPHDDVVVVFLSDGVSNQGSASGVASRAAQLASLGAVIHTFAIGPSASCASGGSGTLQQIANAAGGQCLRLEDPTDLPDVLPGLLASSLDAVEVSIGGGPATAVPNEDLSVDLPTPGAVSAGWTASAALGPGEHVICATAHGTDSGGSGTATDCVTVSVVTQAALDIHPTSCPNPFNQRARGVLPVAVIGSDGLDVADIDPDSIRLDGVAPTRHAFEDIATPFEPFLGKADGHDCTRDGADGLIDLTLKFETKEIADAVGPLPRGEVIVLTLTGQFMDGTSFVGEDVVTVVG